MSALAWIKKNKASSQYVQVAFLAYTYVMLKTGFVFMDNKHLAGAGTQMFDSDALSRNRQTLHANPALFRDTSSDSLLNNLFVKLDPTKDHSTVFDLLTTFQHVAECVNRLLDEPDR
jgi:hypothetical protein